LEDAMRTTIEIDDDLLDQALILHRDRDFELIASMAPLDIDYFSFSGQA
jgi:hypothetical protein